MKAISEKISWREVRNAVFGLIVVFGGLGLAFVTLYAHQTGNPRLAGAAAVASLVFVVLILLFVVPPLARNASREFAQIDLPVELTSGGLIFFGITAIVGFAAWNTGNNLLFLVLSFLLANIAVSFLVNGANLKKLTVKVRFPEAIFANEPTVFFVALDNRKWVFPSFSITLALRGATTDDPFGGREFRFVRPPERLARLFRLPLARRIVGYFVFVGRRGEIEQQTEQLFPVRGRFIIKHFELSTKFPFGFWQQRRRLKVRETEVFVFPPLADPVDISAAAPRQSGQFTSNRRGGEPDLLGLREYQPTDDRRLIDWKASARTGNLIVRELAADNERRISVRLDTALPALEKPGDKAANQEQAARFERGLSLTATILANLARENQPVQLIVNGASGDFAIGKAHLYESLRRLSLLDLKTKINEPPLETKISPRDFTISILPQERAAAAPPADRIFTF